jgi:hypothetical protein
MNRIFHMFMGLFDAGLHPVLVIRSGLDVGVSKLLLDILPDLSVLQVREELDHFHPLFLLGAQLVEVKPYPVKAREDRGSEVVAVGHFLHHFVDVALGILVGIYLLGSFESLLEAVEAFTFGHHAHIRNGVRNYSLS